MKLNKKGDKTLNTVITIILLAALLVIFFVYVFPSIVGSTKDYNAMLKSGDFDGDNKENSYGTDMMDPCPCGYDNVKQQASGKEYCVASYTQAQCNSANDVANKAYKEDKGKKDPVPFFIYSNNKCLYTSDACKYLMLGDENFNEKLLANP